MESVGPQTVTGWLLMLGPLREDVWAVGAGHAGVHFGMSEVNRRSRKICRQMGDWTTPVSHKDTGL